MRRVRGEEASRLVLTEHQDKRGANIGGERYALDTAMWQTIETPRKKSHGRDGDRRHARGPAPYEHHGRRCGQGCGGWPLPSFPGSTEARARPPARRRRLAHRPTRRLAVRQFLNQAASDMTKWLYYGADASAEDNQVLRAHRTPRPLPREAKNRSFYDFSDPPYRPL